MKSFFRTTTIIFIFSLIFFLFNCKEEKKESVFKIIGRDSYFIDSHNGISIYRDQDSRKPMNGHFLVGNKLRKWEELELNKGVLNGEYIVFHENGEKFSSSSFSNGKLHGEDKTFYMSGNLKSVSSYKNGIRYGKRLDYFENGNIESESKIENDVVTESTSYDIIGNIISQMFIKDGRKIIQTIKNGKVFSEQISSTYDNFEAMKFYNEDGSFKAYLRLLDENDNHYLIELNEKGDEIKRIDIKANPMEILKYQHLLANM